MQDLQKRTQRASCVGNVLLAGDFMARVTGLSDEDEPYLSARGLTDSLVNLNGKNTQLVSKERSVPQYREFKWGQ